MLKRASAIADGFSSWVISVHSSVDVVTPGQRADPSADVPLDLGPQRAARGGEGDRDHDVAVAVDRGALGHAELDDVAAELGVDDAAQQRPSRRLRSGGDGTRHAGILPAEAV